MTYFNFNTITQYNQIQYKDSLRAVPTSLLFAPGALNLTGSRISYVCAPQDAPEGVCWQPSSPAPEVLKLVTRGKRQALALTASLPPGRKGSCRRTPWPSPSPQPLTAKPQHLRPESPTTHLIKLPSFVYVSHPQEAQILRSSGPFLTPTPIKPQSLLSSSQHLQSFPHCPLQRTVHPLWRLGICAPAVSQCPPPFLALTDRALSWGPCFLGSLSANEPLFSLSPCIMGMSNRCLEADVQNKSWPSSMGCLHYGLPYGINATPPSQ